MTRSRLIPPNEPTMPAPIVGPMPNGDAEDPPVHCVALAAARRIGLGLLAILVLGIAVLVVGWIILKAWSH